MVVVDREFAERGGITLSASYDDYNQCQSLGLESDSGGGGSERTMVNCGNCPIFKVQRVGSYRESSVVLCPLDSS